MRLLLDTHVLLWSAYAPANIPAGVRDAITAAELVFASTVSAYEIALKFKLGKLDFARTLVEDYGNQLALRGIASLPIGPSHGRAAGLLDLAHRDPFDRMLAAQARLEALQLVSSDPAFDRFGVARLW